MCIRDSYSTADDVMRIQLGDISGDGALNIACVTFGSDGIAYAFKPFAPAPNLPPYTPKNPLPADGATYVDIDADLSWDGGDPNPADTVTYDIYFGTSSPPPKIVNNQTDTFYDQGTMSYNTQYFWKIVAWDDHNHTTEGTIWDFTTRGPNNPPYEPSDPDPPDGATDVTTGAISWTGGDPDPGDIVTYDVYFGTPSPPPLVVSGQSGITYDVGTMTPNTHYFWKIVAWDNYGASTEGSIWEFTTAEEPLFPDLDCDGELSWVDVKPGATVSGEFSVFNVGDPYSDLNWEIESCPDWGTWTFTPESGEDLTPEDSPVIVQVEVTAPDQQNEEFIGEVKIVNSEDPDDYCIILVSLATPYSHQSYMHPLLQRILEEFPNAFPIIRFVLGL